MAKQNEPLIRLAQSDDLPTLVSIYNQAVATRHSTADLEPVSIAERQIWFEAHQDSRYPIWVIERAGSVLGWVSLSAYRPGRGALQGLAEVSYYVHADHWGKGLGSRLLAFSIKAASKLGFHSLIAILLAHNEASIRLLKKYGFSEWGRLPQVVEIDGKRFDHVWYGRKLLGD